MNQSLPERQQAILAKLMEGNKRFVEQKAEHPRQTIEYRGTLVRAQSPLAAVLSCADSRVPPEIVFDQGLGDLFVVRVAANIASEHVLAAMEFATLELKVPLIIVMGHTLCGAIQASMTSSNLPGHLPHIANELEPSLNAARVQAQDVIAFAVQHNAQRTAAALVERSPILAQAMAEGNSAVQAAYYDMATGKVELLGT